MRFPFSEYFGRSPASASWALIAFLFFGQAVASILLSVAAHIPCESVGFPIFILFLGGFAAMAFVRLDRDGDIGAWKWWIPPGLYLVFISLLSNEPLSGAEIPFSTDYFHPVEYMFLGLFLARVWYPVLETNGVASFAVRVLLVGMVLGAADEVHQNFIPGRDMSFFDFLRDTAGLSVACVLTILSRPLHARFGSSVSGKAP
jgi:VanZ family protein